MSHGRFVDNQNLLMINYGYARNIHVHLSHIVELNITIHTLIPSRINPHILIIKLGKTTENLSHEQYYLRFQVDLDL